MSIYALGEHTPQFGEGCWVAHNATVIGAVEAGHNVNIWYNVVIRGDRDPISIGDNTNIQDGSILHTDDGVPLTIGADVTVGHMAMLHGCTIGAGSLIGIKAVILNGAKIGKNCLIGAGAFIGEGKEIPDGSLVLGAPGKGVRQLSAEQIKGINRISDHYVQNFKRYRNELKPDES